MPEVILREEEEEAAGRDPLDFSDIALPEEKKPVTLAQMADALEPIKPGFWAKAPKLNKQIEIIEIVERVQESNKPTVALRGYLEIGAKFLYVEDKSRESYRLAAEEEIGEAFDLADLQALVQSYINLKPGSEPGKK